MYITQQGNAGITGSLSVGSLANLAEDQRMSIANPSTYYGDMFGLTLPYSFDPGVMYQVAQGGTNWNGQIASGSNIITSYPAGGNYNANYASYISVGDYVRDYNTNFRARVIAVSATTMSLDRNIAVSYTGSNFSYWPRVYGHTAGTLVYNTTTNKVNYWTTSSLNVLLDSSGSQSLTGSLIITGSSNSVLLEIDSPAVNNILYVSGSGNIGIGVSNPLNSLQVKDSISIGSTGNAGALYLRRSSDGAPLGQFYNSGNYTILKESQGAGGILETGYGTYALKWTGIGGSPSVGIGFDGTVSATTHIKGAGTTSSTTALLVQNANASASFSVRDDQSIIINGSSSMTIPNSGSALTLTRTGNYSNVGTKPILNILDDTGGANVAKGGIYVSITGASNNKFNCIKLEHNKWFQL